MRDEHGNFSWSAFPVNHWDHYYAAGQQQRFYRQQPPHLANVPFEEETPRWLDFVLRIFERLAR